MRLFALVMALAAVSTPALAGAEWSFVKEKGRPVLRGFSGEVEGDDEFWARRRADRTVEVGLGAHSEIGKSAGDVVQLAPTSAGKSATVKGRSRKSDNFEMTSGTELQATIPLADPLFAVLHTGKPISVTGSSLKKPMIWKVKNLNARAAAFIKACSQ